MPTTAGKIYLGSVLVSSGISTSAAWVRPTDWPSLPSVAATDQVFRGLHAVFDHGSNFATIRCTGAFTVDWGDGSSPVNVASNTTAEYNYNYSASGLGSVTSRGYKTAIVTVTPQAGQTLSVIDIGQKHTQAGLASNRNSQWLDMRLAMNNSGTVTTYNSTWLHRLLEQFEWIGGSSVQSSFSSFLSGCSSLQSIPLFNTAAGINFSSFILNCASVSRIQATFPASQNISFANLSLGPTALNEIYTNLPTASGSPRTITVTGNWGTTSHNPSIATAKGWTVTA